MKAIILGATGLVGNELLHKILNATEFNEVIIFVRHEIKLTHPKLKQIISNLTDLDEHQEQFQNIDTLFCALGTTIKKAKTKEAFKQVDYHFPLKAAQIFKENNGKHLVIITALGSDPDSSIFYNKTKGDLERDLKKLHLNKLSIVRPSLILGDRQEARFFEGLGQKTAPLFNIFLPKKYQAVKANTIAETMLNLALNQNVNSGIEVETI